LPSHSVDAASARCTVWRSPNCTQSHATQLFPNGEYD